MRPSTTTILATAAAVASMVLLAGCGGDGPEGAPPPPATTKAAPARNAAAADTPRLFVVDANGNDARVAFRRQVEQCIDAIRGDRVAGPAVLELWRCVRELVGVGQPSYPRYPVFSVDEPPIRR
jgi:hypothetical protein